MQIQDIIKHSLDYIEHHLKTEITAQELAAMVNYSTFHYYRIFSEVMGSSVSNYILKRRLDHALGEIAGGRKAIEVVLEYGFETYAGFYKAFTKMYGCSPKKYLSIYSGHTPRKPEVVIVYTEKELREILGNWEIKQGLPLRDVFIIDGTRKSDKVWQIGEDYFLKTGSREQLLKNLKIAKALEKQHFVSALPLLTKTGSEYLEDKEVFVLSRRIPGRPLTRADRWGANRVHYGFEYGKGIARLHRALQEIQRDISPDEVNLYQTIVTWALPKVRQQNIQWNMGIEEKFIQEYQNTLEVLYDKLPKQLIHRDPNPNNILFLEGKVSGFVDFDISEMNVRLWDVCYCATGILSDDEGYETWLDILGGILHGYNEENALTEEEKQAVFYVICSIQMIFLAYCEGMELKQLAGTNRKMLQFIIDNRERVTQIF